MGGLSARELMQGPAMPRRGDFVDNCLEKLSGKPRRLRVSEYGGNEDESDEIDDDEDGYRGEREEKTTIVGTKLHGPTFDENDNYKESSGEVIQSTPHISSC